MMTQRWDDGDMKKKVASCWNFPFPRLCPADPLPQQVGGRANAGQEKQKDQFYYYCSI